MLPGMELMGCQNLAVPAEVMHHVVRVESSYNPYAIGVVGGRLVRQPRNLPEAVSTVRMLESRGYNFSLGLAQVNRYNLGKYGLDSYEKAFEVCPNLLAGSRILAECHGRSGGDWGKSFSCYYSGNFVTGYRHGYVQKVYASMGGGKSMSSNTAAAPAIAVVDRRSRRVAEANRGAANALPRQAALRRIVDTPAQPQYVPQQQALPASMQSAVAALPAQQMDITAATAYVQPAQAQVAEVVATRITPEAGADSAFVF